MSAGFRSSLSILLFIFISFTRAEAQYDFLLHKSYAERYYPVDSLFFNRMKDEDSTSFFSKVDRCKALAEKEHDKELALEMELVRINYYIEGKQQQIKLFEQPMLELMEQADRKKIRQLQVRTRIISGEFYLNKVKQYGKAFTNYLDAYYLLKDIPAGQFPNKAEIVMIVASFYYRMGDMANARKYYSESISYPLTYKKNLAISPYNTLGLIFRDESQYDSAVHYFKKATEVAVALRDSVWIGIISGNLGITYMQQKRYDEAIPLLELDIQQCLKAGETDNGVNSLIKLAQIRELKNEHVLAADLAEQTKQYLPATKDPYRHLQDLYPLLGRLSMYQGDSRTAYLFADSALKIRDSISRRINALTIVRAEQKLEMERYNGEIKLREAEKRRILLIRNGLILLVIMIAIISWQVITRQRQRHAQQQRILETEKKTAEKELAAAQKQLDDFTNAVHEKNELVDKITTELERLKKTNLDAGELMKQNELLVQLQQSTLLTDEQWNDFKLIFEKVHTGYLNRLREKLPGLSPAETRFMALSKLKLSNKEMAGMLGISPDAIRMYRHRLRKKLNLPEDGNLDELVEII